METSIVERLEQLKQWQVEQQEKLLKRQQIQRENLSHNQDYIYKALGFSHDLHEDTEDIHRREMDEAMRETSMIQHNMDIPDNVLETTQEEVLTNADVSCENYKGEDIEEVNPISIITDENENSTKNFSSSILSAKGDFIMDLSIEGIKPLASNNILPNKCVSMDDIPVSSSKKNFQALLEEKLRTESDSVVLNVRTDPKIKMKKPFLKKGEGLSRFKTSVNSRSLLASGKRRVSLNTQHNNGTVHKTRNEIDKNKKSIMPGNVPSKSTNTVALVNEMQRLNLKTVSSPRNKLHANSEFITPTKQSKYNAIFNRTKRHPEINVSDSDSKIERELEEVRIFELLEEKAENSSFCSTSSTVLAFLQQSTPFKVKEKLNYRENNNDDIAIGTKKQNSKQINDKKPLLEQRAHIKNFKSNVIKQLEQFNIRNKHPPIYSTTVDSYWDTATVDNEQEETQKAIATDQVLQSNEAYLNHSQSHNVSSDEPALTVSLSSSDEEEDISTGDNNLTHADASHHVRFSEHNEYRTIELVDVPNALNESSLRDHLEMESDCSVNMLDINTSDATQQLSLNYEKYRSSLKAIGHEEAINASLRLALQCDITADSLDRIVRASGVPKEENILHYENESSGEDICDDNECSSIEETLQTSIRSISSLYPPSLLPNVRRELNTHTREDYVSQNEPEEVINKITELHSSMEDTDCYSYEKRTDTFRPEFLKSRLLELENEIDVFRKESSALLRQRRKLQEDQVTLYKEYAEKKRQFEENKRKVQNQLAEEKQKLSHERITIENRARDIQEKEKQNKLERQKIQDLQEQLKKLRDEINIKESKWNNEARYKTELRILRSEISNLKQKISSLQNVKKTNMKNTKKIGGQIITKTINENKRIVTTASKDVAKMSRELSDVPLNASIHDSNGNKSKDKSKVKDRSMESITKAIDVKDDFEKEEDNVSVNRKEFKQRGSKENRSECKENLTEQIAIQKLQQKRNVYESLLRDATSDLMDDQNPHHIMQDISNFHQPMINVQTDNSGSKDNDEFYSGFTNKDIKDIAACITNDIDPCSKRLMTQDRNKNEVRTQNRESPSEKNSSFTQCPSLLRHQSNSGTNDKDAVKQIRHSDGRIEYWYPNGNVKKIFPDQGVIKMFYYNGDVRKNYYKDGKVKYFYAKTLAWHTTTSDGLDILEFSDGEVQKRMSDGTIEVSFPDGVTRITKVDGTEKWTLSDGTVAQILTNGDKIFTLPNGEREVHTKAYKRREYLDGTVKLVYADDTQETRYSNGRIRLKDKDGNLLRDSHSS